MLHPHRVMVQQLLLECLPAAFLHPVGPKAEDCVRQLPAVPEDGVVVECVLEHDVIQENSLPRACNVGSSNCSMQGKTESENIGQ